MLTRQLTIRNRAGIHCRPSGVIMQELEKYPGTVLRVTPPGGKPEVIDGMLSLLSLCLTCGQQVTIDVAGGAEEAALQHLGDLFEFEFDFPPR